MNYHLTADTDSIKRVEEVRRANLLPAIVGATVKLRKSGKEWKACCPLHAEKTPSFTIYDRGLRFKCFGCGVQGDVFDYIKAIYRCSFAEAVVWLDGGMLPKANYDPAVICREQKEDRTPEALAIWEAAQDATGTPVEAYLRARAITLPMPPTIRFTRLHYGKSGPQYPVLVALVQNAAGEPIGIQRTYLDPVGNGKAAVAKPKLSLGGIRGGAIRLGKTIPVMLACEGLEDGLTLRQEIRLPVWVSAGASNLSAMKLPGNVYDVTIGADNDKAGFTAAAMAADAFVNKGVAARIIQPLGGHKDFNAELMAALKGGA
jgi:DNA primase